MQGKTTGIILKINKIKAHNSFYTVLTPEGKVSMIGTGNGKYKSPLNGCRIFSLCEILWEERKGVYYITSADCIKGFDSLASSLEHLALANYMCDVVSACTEENMDCFSLLRFLTICLCHAEEGTEPKIIKAVFEIRLSSLIGYSPDGDSSLFHGCSEDVKKAITYIATAEEKRIFSFQIQPQVLLELNKTAEDYLLRHIERRFSSLTYLKSILT